MDRSKPALNPSDHERRKAFGERLRAARKRCLIENQPVTGEMLAQRVGVSPSTISFYERGKSWPAMETLFKLAEVLQVEPTWLLTGDQLSPEQPKSEEAEILEALRESPVFRSICQSYVVTKHKDLKLLEKLLEAWPKLHYRGKWVLMHASVHMGALAQTSMDHHQSDLGVD
jgi:transcriptional regulator with XRE-family HTH domain